MAPLPAGLLAFIKQPNMQVGMPSVSLPSVGADPTLQARMKQAYEQKMADEAAQKIGGVMGNQAQAEQIGAFDEGIGGYDYTPNQQASGIYEGANPQQAQQLEFAQGLIESGNPMLQKQGMSALQKIQEASAPVDMSMAKTFAMGAEPKIIDGKNVNKGKMIRAVPNASELGYRTFGTAYDPRNVMVDAGTQFVSQYDSNRIIPKNLTEAARQTQLGKSQVLDWFKENQGLRETEGGRIAGLKKARKFFDAISSGEMSSGGVRKMLSYIPFTFTEQGQMDEEFGSFAETAARQALKESGETKPTDADVTGMKRAMFGVGRDEQTNINLLQDFIDAAERGNMKKFLSDQGKSFINTEAYSKYKKPDSKSSPDGDENISKSGIKFTEK